MATTESRQAILDRLTSRVVDANPLPTIDPSRLTTFEDPIAKFAEMLAFVGGEAHQVDRIEEVREILSKNPVFADATRIASVVPAAIQGNVDASQVDDPHALSSLDWVIARGEFMVAENGAIWVDGSTLPHRVMLFIPQYLAIVVSRNEIVSNMHEAYQRIGTPKPGFGVFVSGPSKTADIEQSLVLGAHGCRKLQVFLVP
ncbi:Lactate utilization protein C [Rubripirellula lacrimiformis]|uniref:Lactate utilization protein C n=1 Tax=Rubripirellula lacrimiformis TaxID=1930273 RepID=A0A517NAK9_9BACT|nr:LUD domain-containing protein [Rubripirellula lacrimiformis]QDT04162.1 Lactate utilization protein C [Rubripirellula lacrimiformis]